MKVWVVTEHRGWRSPHHCEAGVWLVSDRLAEAEAFAQARMEEPFEDDEPPSSWFVELREMTVGAPLSAQEACIVINRRGERATHPESLDTRP